LERLAACFFEERPGCWTDGSLAFALTEDSLAVLQGVRCAWASGGQSILPRVYEGGQPVGFHPDRHLPKPAEALDGFLARLQRERSSSDTGMVVEDAPVFAPALFLRIQAFLERLYARVGMPAGGAHSELFLGDYRSSFFSIHKDSLHTVTTVLHGRKRFLLWPSSVFDEFEAVGPVGPGQATLPAEHDTPELRAKAIVVEGGPGTVFFWPASWWHVAEQVPGTDFAITATVALSPVVAKAPGACFRMVTRGLEDLFDEGWSPVPPPLPRTGGPEDAARSLERMVETVGNLWQHGEVRAAYSERVLAWLSANGFEQVPEPAEAIELDGADLMDCTGHPRIWWQALDPTDPSPDAPITVAVNGHVLTSSRAFLPLVDAIQRRRTISVSTLIEELSSALDTDALHSALSALHAVRAFTLLPKESSSDC
jgi:hypothetical protein